MRWRTAVIALGGLVGAAVSARVWGDYRQHWLALWLAARLRRRSAGGASAEGAARPSA